MLNIFLRHAVSQGWGGSVVPGLRGTAWKEKVASIGLICQAVQSGKNVVIYHMPHKDVTVVEPKCLHPDPPLFIISVSTA